MKGLVSVIVPVYNVEQYLPRCVDSIINQTYKNLEIILVDDGSQDGCPKLCDDYKDQDDRVTVIHKHNGGLSDARNAGLDVASGDYITFIDSDDWYELETIEKLVNAIEVNNADIVSYGAFIATDEEKNAEHLVFEKNTAFEYAVAMCEGKKDQSVCMKLFDRDVIINRRFKVGRLNEDFYFMMLMLFKECKIVTVPFVGYNYYKRKESITHTGNKISLHDAVLNCLELIEIAKKECPELKKYIARMGLHQSAILMIVMPDEQRTMNGWLKDTLLCVDRCYKYRRQKTLNKKERIIVWATHIAPIFTSKCLKILWKFKAADN